MPVYASLGVRTVINARGNATLAGGTLMDPAVLEAMAEAARSFVRIADLEAAASARIAAATGAEAGYATCGAAAALTLGTAAILVGLDPDRIDRCPQTDGRPDGMLVQRVHRNGYDHLVRAAGARLVEVGGTDGATADELDPRSTRAPRACSSRPTRSRPGCPSRRDRGRPSARAARPGRRLVNLPPRSNLRRLIGAGATSSRSAAERRSGARRRPGSWPGAPTSSGPSDCSTRISTCCRPRGRDARSLDRRPHAHPESWHRPLDEGGQGGDRRAARRAGALSGPRRGGGDRPLAAARRRAHRRPRGDRRVWRRGPSRCRRPTDRRADGDPGRSGGLWAVGDRGRAGVRASGPDHHAGRPRVSRRGPPARRGEPARRRGRAPVDAFAEPRLHQRSALASEHRPPGLDDVARRPERREVRDRIARDGDQVGGQTRPDRARGRRPGRALPRRRR